MARRPVRRDALCAALVAALLLVGSARAGADPSTFVFDATSEHESCSGATSSITAYAAWESSGGADFTIDIDGQPSRVVTITSSATSGSNTVTFNDVSPGVHTVNYTASTETVRATITVCGTQLSITSPTTLTYGSSGTVTGVLTDSATGHGIGGQTVHLFALNAIYATNDPASQPWSAVAVQTTSSTGAVSASVSPHINTLYEWRFTTTSAHVASTSPASRLTVRQRVTIYSPQASGYAAGHVVTFWGQVSPAQAGRTVYLQIKASTGWQTVASATLKQQVLPNGGTGIGYVIKYAPHTSVFRTYRPATTTNGLGVSRTLTIPVIVS